MPHRYQQLYARGIRGGAATRSIQRSGCARLKAVVVFCDSNLEEGDRPHPIAWLLKPGFKHCYCAFVHNGLWLQADYERGIPVIKYMTTADFDLAGYYRELGATVVEIEQGDRPLLGPFVPSNCVGFVKSILCLHTWALTPWQLYQSLKGRACL